MIFLFGLPRLNTASMLKLAAATMTGYGAVIALLYRDHAADFPLRQELFQWLLLAGLLVWFSVMGGYISALRARVRDHDTHLRAVTRDLQTQSERLQIAQLASRMVVLDWDIIADKVTFSDSPVWLRGPLPVGGIYPLFKNQVHADDLDAFLAARQHAIDTVTGSAPEFRVVRTDGPTVWVQSHQTVFAGADGKAVRMVAAIRDITAQKENEAKLIAARGQAERASAAKDDFLATMSHEIRTPLNGMLGMLELLSLSLLQREQAETLAIARDSGGALRRIIDDILDHAKIEAGRLEIVTEPVVLTDLLQQIVNAYSAVASSKGLVLERQVDARISPVLLTDPLRLTQVLGNFISNAVKFSAESTVHLRADFLGRDAGRETVRIAVTDKGIGMTADAQARLFQPFMQAGVDTTSLYGGTGLGLAISRRLAEMLGGGISVESAPGEGTTISITLTLQVSEVMPEDHTRAVLTGAAQRLSSAPARGLASTDAAAPADAIPGPWVLAVDDSPSNRLLIVRQLKQLGLQAETAADGQEALTLLHWHDYALVITDCNMPVMDGYAFARA